MSLNRRKIVKTLGLGVFGLVGMGAAWFATTGNRRVQFLRQLIYDGKRGAELPKHKPFPQNWSDNNITLCWVSHSTVLINFYGVWIVTDPVFSSRVGPDLWFATIGPKRYVLPALSIEELPGLDVILLSHAHYDHMDLPTLKLLKNTPHLVTAKNTTDILQKADIKNPTELGWGESLDLNTQKGKIKITSIEVNHWGRRWPDNTYRGYNGYIIERGGKKVLFAGDTAYADYFSRYRNNGGYEIAIMPIGAYNPWIRSHCSPEQAVQMANAAGAKYIVPVHHKTFKLSDEPLDEPIQRFLIALEKEKERVGLKEVGETFTLGNA
ncbi:MAG: MBL fold metallo-hydrolase [Verrucomicrobiae bacterium]|nr:MBL fold metallo-hydrolase [Verrucomicrobiae bacterium]